VDHIPDRAKAIGTEDEIMEEFKQVSQLIKKYSKKFVAENL